KLLNIENLVHFGSDGASTMLNHQNRVAARLKKYNPFITENHYKAHHLYLAGQDAAKKMVQNTLEEPELMILNIVSTRWLSFLNVIHNFYQNLESIKGALLDEAANNMQEAILLADIDQTFEIITMFL
ncbi:16503_t:CDS:2, partial [Dentiscutata heterogama]